MRKTLVLILMTTLLAGALLVSCNSDVSEMAQNGNKVVSLSIGKSNSKSISATSVGTGAESLYWYYSAEKTDASIYSTGATEWRVVKGTNENPERGLVNADLGLFSVGKWSFNFYAFPERQDTKPSLKDTKGRPTYAYSHENYAVELDGSVDQVGLTIIMRVGNLGDSVVFFSDNLNWVYDDTKDVAGHGQLDLSNRKVYLKVFYKLNEENVQENLLAISDLEEVVNYSATFKNFKNESGTDITVPSSVEGTEYTFYFRVYVTAASQNPVIDINDELIGEVIPQNVVGYYGGHINVSRSENDTVAVGDNEEGYHVIIDNFSRKVVADYQNGTGTAAIKAAEPSSSSGVTVSPATTVTSSGTAVSTSDSTMNTTVSIPKAALASTVVAENTDTDGNTTRTVTSHEDTLNIKVRTDGEDLTNFNVQNSDEQALVGIDLSMVRLETTTTTTTYSDNRPTETNSTDNSSLEESQRKVTDFNGKYLTVSTYIGTGYGSVNVVYGGNGDAPVFDVTNTNPDALIAASNDSESNVGTGYNPNTGLIVFKTSHFSSFFVTGKPVFELVRGSSTVHSYPKLEEVFTGALVGDTIRLLENCVVGGSPALNVQGTILDLNGYAMTVAEGSKVVINAADVQIKNGVIKGDIELGSGASVEIGNGSSVSLSGDITVGTGSTLTISDGTYNGTSFNGTGTVSIKGGSFSSDPSSYVAAGYCSVLNNGMYIVGEHKAAETPEYNTYRNSDNHSYTHAEKCARCGGDVGGVVDCSEHINETTGHCSICDQIVKVNVTFDANGGSGTMGNQAVYYKSGTQLTANGFSMDGFVFAGWNTKANGKGVSYDNEASVTFDTDTTLYAKWQKDNVTRALTFEFKSGGKITVRKPTGSTTLKYTISNGDSEPVLKDPQSGSETEDNPQFKEQYGYYILYIPVQAGDKISFYANGTGSTTNNSFMYIHTDYNTWCDVYGNIMSLKDGLDSELNPSEDFKSSVTITNDYEFYGLLLNNNSIQDASGVVLPATTLTAHCYDEMFYRCENLIAGPEELPATTMADYCYSNMFIGCSSLTKVPSISATTLAKACYQSMFSGCKSLTSLPEDLLGVNTMVDYCYSNMFSGCTGLTSLPEGLLPATELAEGCYSAMFQGCKNTQNTPNLPATTMKTRCYYNMFGNCDSLTSLPDLPAMNLADKCYQAMFYGSKFAIAIPKDYLPATTLADYCYDEMFRYCVNVTQVPDLPATVATKWCYEYMYANCKSLVNPPVVALTTAASQCCFYMFGGCSSLVESPVLHIETLDSSCYAYLFKDCSSLTKITCCATDVKNYSRYSWVDGVPASGTFYKSSTVTFVNSTDYTYKNEWHVASKDNSYQGVPSGWNVIDIQ